MTEPAQSVECNVLQSPIALEDVERQQYRAKPLLHLPDTEITRYEFDAKEKQWNVHTPFLVNNNQQQYRLSQFHTHIPAEHTINGVRHALELHFVFEAEPQPVTPGTEEGFGHVMVLGLLAQLSKSRTSSLLQNILKNEPLHISAPQQYWTYEGSLTTPPFTTTINWNVQKHVLSITAEDLDRFRPLSKGVRELQPRAGRNITLTCACHK